MTWTLMTFDEMPDHGSRDEIVGASSAQDGGSSGAAALVHRAVLEATYEGQYKPGERLTEAQLTRQFNVSRSSAREALSRLAAEGVVELSRHRGAKIRTYSEKEV